MNIIEKRDQMIELLDGVQPLYVEAEQKMLATKETLQTAELELKMAEIAAHGYADGKNAEQRKLQMQIDPDVIRARARYEQASHDFNRAYAIFAEHRAVQDYVRSVTALLAVRE